MLVVYGIDTICINPNKHVNQRQGLPNSNLGSRIVCLD
jgi:hypothetical protein